MSIETAVFVVQRGDQQFSCKGRDLQAKFKTGDLMPCQEGSVQRTINLEDIKLLTEDVSEREFIFLETLTNMQNVSQGVYAKNIDRFFCGEWSSKYETNMVFWDGGNSRMIFTTMLGESGLSYAQDSTRLFGVSRYSGPPTCWSYDVHNGQGQDLVSYPDGVLMCVNNEDGTTTYGFISTGATDKLEIYYSYDAYFGEPQQLVQLDFDLDLGLTRVRSFDEEGVVMVLSLNKLSQYDLRNPYNSKEISPTGVSNPKLQDVCIHNGYHYTVGLDRKIYWGRLGQRGATFTVPNEVGDTEWGWYPPQFKTISGTDDEFFIGGTKGAFYTAKGSNPDPSTWDWKEDIYYSPAGGAILFGTMVSNGSGDILIGANDSFYMSTVPKLLIPCTDDDGVTKTVTAAQLKELFAPPWEGQCGIYHVIIDDPADVNYAGQMSIYNLDTEQRVTSISAAGEWIITGATTKFENSKGNWTFGNLTDTGCVRNMKYMFKNARAFNSDISNWDVSNVSNMRDMFHNAQTFNSDISNWDVGEVTDAMKMFQNAKKFNSDISNWNVSNLKFAHGIFHDAHIFNQDLSKWDTGRFLKMGNMFENARAFNSDISNWDVSSAYELDYAFYGALAFNQDISGWDVSNANDMASMFNNAQVFNQNLTSWCVTKITSEPNSFRRNSSMPTDGSYDPKWGTCP